MKPVAFLPEGFLLSRPIIFGLLILVFMVWVCMSAVFVFHWKRYGMKERFIMIGEGVYFFVSAILIVLAIVSFISI